MPEINGWHLPGKDGYFTRFVQGSGYKKNGFQREHLLVAFEFVRQWDLAIDVGAHVGFWTRDMAERFEMVYAFEPAPDTYECLALNMAEHPNVRIFPLAVGEQTGCCSVFDSVGSNTGSRFVRPNANGITPMVSLDGLDLPGCNLLKIDVEGFESAVLRGAKHLIRKYMPVVIMETDKRFRGRYGEEKHAAMHYLVDRLGYREVWPGDSAAAKKQARPDRVFIRRGSL